MDSSKQGQGLGQDVHFLAASNVNQDIVSDHLKIFSPNLLV